MAHFPFLRDGQISEPRQITPQFFITISLKITGNGLQTLHKKFRFLSAHTLQYGKNNPLRTGDAKRQFREEAVLAVTWNLSPYIKFGRLDFLEGPRLIQSKWLEPEFDVEAVSLCYAFHRLDLFALLRQKAATSNGYVAPHHG